MGATGERSRFLCIATEIGCRPAGFGAKEEEEGDDNDGGQKRSTANAGAAAAASSSSLAETFIVMYYFTIGQAPDYTVTIKVSR